MSTAHELNNFLSNFRASKMASQADQHHSPQQTPNVGTPGFRVAR